MRRQLEGRNDEQTPGDVYQEGIRETVALGRESIGSTEAGSMPQALQSRRPLLRSLEVANLPETVLFLFLILTLHRPRNIPLRQPYFLTLLHRRAREEW